MKDSGESVSPGRRAGCARKPPFAAEGSGGARIRTAAVAGRGMRGVQISFAADMGYLRPTLAAMASVIARASRPVTVHLLGDSLPDAAVAAAEMVCAQRPGHRLVHHDVSELLSELPREGKWPRAALARLRIPSLIEGRVLHLDGDTMAFADVAPLFDLDLCGKAVAAVRDLDQLHWMWKETPVGRSRLPVVSELMAPHPIHDYFNSGVLLMDADAIRADAGLLQSVEDMDRASGMEYPDQDHLNMVFKGRTAFLDPSWNVLYGRSRHAMRVARAVLPAELVHDSATLRIAHYTHDPKPWKRVGFDRWSKTSFVFRLLPNLARYRVNARWLLSPLEGALREAGL